MTNDPFLRRVADAIIRHNLIADGSNSPIIVALSGGADSTALLASLTMLGYKCVAAHCNYHLRGNESNRDQKHAESIARRFGADFQVIDFDVDTYRNSNPRESIEMACRELRYQWFQTLRQQYKATAIAVGHNADDNIETLIINLLRGTGIAGLRGIRPHNNRNIIRPLLDITREEILEFLTRNKIGYITDSSNLTTQFDRNKIRLELLPELRRLFPNSEEGLKHTINILSETDRFYRQTIEEKRKIYSTPSGIKLHRMIAEEPSARLLLYEFLSTEGFNRSQTDAMINSADSSGIYFSSGSHTWMIDRGILRNVSEQIDVDKAEFNDLFEISIHPIDEFHIEPDQYTAYFDASVLDGAPLSIRYWQRGDRMQPFGMKSTKKLSDIFANAKVPDNIKTQIPLLTKGSIILWVTGLRPSNLYRVESSSTHYVTIKYTGQRYF